MKVLVTALGTLGDIYPLLMVSQALMRRGHEVVFFTLHHHADLVESYHIPFHPILPKDYHHNMLKFDGSGAAIKETSQYLLEQPMPALYEAIKQHKTDESNCLLLCSIASAYVTRINADIFRLPSAILHYNPIAMMSKIEPPRMDARDSLNKLPRFLRQSVFNITAGLLLRLTITKSVNRIRAQHGLSPVSAIHFYEWVNTGSSCSKPVACMGLFPEWFSCPLDRWHVSRVSVGLPKTAKLFHFPLNAKHHEKPLPANVVQFLQQHPNPIVFTFGTFSNKAVQFFEVAKKAVQQLNRPAIFLSRYDNNIPADLPSSILHCHYLSLETILPHASAIVHHGGVGTLSQALLAGVPQIVRPNMGDQFDNASRLVNLGVGLEILPKHFTVKQLTSSLNQLLEQADYRSRAQAIQEKMAGAGGMAIEQVCDHLEQLVAADS